jgi:hypothetical protein
VLKKVPEIPAGNEVTALFVALVGMGVGEAEGLVVVTGELVDTGAPVLTALG